ncbi:hypothetical protein [Rhodopirellula baltica]|uniref:Uncharacterized protein n=1 Tax=Rhodopirellula baltica SWK14 TaxID=993516 RepID=L7CKM5_RHOBT|nr:hypothetical protein [Rhodopirellula baltica]ELP34513.1 hypothetical protein RBSWK_01523 [Rhodopirellula baltica SWK14]
MTIVVQFENNSWYAEAVAIMADPVFDHPIMRDALDRIARDQGFDFVSSFERQIDYDEVHRQIDESR